MSEARIYLDHNATTPVDPRVLEAMLPWFTEYYGNAASATHGIGCDAAGGSEMARSHVAVSIHATGKDIIFTSGATEANNLAIQGVAHFYADRGRHIITVATEHSATLETCEFLKNNGWDITIIDVDQFGLVDPQAIADAIRSDTVLVTVMMANNEIGTIHDIAAIGKITRERGVFLHVDAAQAYGKIPIDVDALRIDLMSLSAHKCYGPKGVGALYVRRREPRVRLQPLQYGGGHERGMRAGTINVPGIVGFARAGTIAHNEMSEEAKRLSALKERLWTGIKDVASQRLGHPTQCLPGTLNVIFPGIDARYLLRDTPRVAASLGAACTSVTPKPSHVLRAIGIDWRTAEGAVRFSVGRFNTAAEIDEAAQLITAGVKALRERRPEPAVDHH